MNDPDGASRRLDQKRAEALGLALTKSLGGVKDGLEKQNSTILALMAVVAAMPETAQVDPRRVGALIEMMMTSQPHNQKMRDELTAMAGKLIALARSLRDQPDEATPSN